MWANGTNFKAESVKTNINPYYAVRLYEDTFSFTGSNLYGTNPFNKFFYDFDYQRNFAASQQNGTPILNGFVGTADALGTEMRMDGSGSTATWTSPVITPYYQNASWDTLTYLDFTYHGDGDILFKENFETREGINRNGGYIGAVNADIVYVGSLNTARWLRITNHGTGETTDVEYPEPNLPNSIFEEGEIHIKFRLDNFLAGAPAADPKFKLLMAETTAGGIYGVEISNNGGAGSFLVPRLVQVLGMSTNTLVLGTIGTGIFYELAFNYKLQVTDKVEIESWLGTYYTSGTFNKINNFGNYKSLTVGEYESNVGGSSGTYWLDDIQIYGTREHTGTYRDTYINSKTNIKYYIRTGTDGTNFTQYYDITGTRDYTQEAKAPNVLNCLYIGTAAIFGDYAQIQVVTNITDGGTRIPTPQGTFNPYIRSLSLQSHLDLTDNSIYKVGNIGMQIENENKYGLITVNSNNITLANNESPFLNTKKFLGDR